MNDLVVVVGDRVVGMHRNGKIRGNVRAVNGEGIHVDVDGRIVRITVADITQLNGRRVNG